MTKLTSTGCDGLNGQAFIPGDKSISHRALILGALAEGMTEVEGLLHSEDVIHTAKALHAMGVEIDLPNLDKTTTEIHGVGLGGLLAPEGNLYMGNSGTSARLLMGVVAGQSFKARFVGDDSLSERPMKRVMEPLSQMGADFEVESGDDCLPITVTGVAPTQAIEYTLPVASAQVKSAILLAGLFSEGETCVFEPVPTRAHTENMLKSFGADLKVTPKAAGASEIRLAGGPALKGQKIVVPGDPSSAAFLTVAALITKNSEIYLPGIGMDARRDGLYRSLIEMGADITYQNERVVSGERVVDMTVRSSALRGIDVPADRAASMIDEYPILFIAAAFATGTSRMSGLHELTVKESNRLQAMADGLAACGIECKTGADDIAIKGCSGPPAGGAEIATCFDHRIAMSFLVLGCAAKNQVTIDDKTPIQTSFPDFLGLMRALGAEFE